MSNKRYIDPEVKARVKAEANWTCFYCGVHSLKHMTIDHYIPISRGGTSKEENLVCACTKCNNKKADMLPEEYEEFLEHEEYYKEIGYVALRRILQKANC